MAENEVESLGKGSGDIHSKSRAEADSGTHELHQQTDALQEMETRDNGYRAGDTLDSQARPFQEATDTHTHSESRLEADDGRAHMVRQQTVQHFAADHDDHPDSIHSLSMQRQMPALPLSNLSSDDPGACGPIETTEADLVDQLAEVVPPANGEPPHVSLCQVQ